MAKKRRGKRIAKRGNLRMLIVQARFYDDIADALLSGARAVLDEAGVEYTSITVPGALEIPAAIAMALEASDYDGVVALGCVIRGETYHFEIVSNESARGLMELSLRGIPLGNGILTVDTAAQAAARAALDQGDKGGTAAKAALALIRLKRRLATPRQRR